MLRSVQEKYRKIAWRKYIVNIFHSENSPSDLFWYSWYRALCITVRFGEYVQNLVLDGSTYTTPVCLSVLNTAFITQWIALKVDIHTNFDLNRKLKPSNLKPSTLIHHMNPLLAMTFLMNALHINNDNYPTKFLFLEQFCCLDIGGDIFLVGREKIFGQKLFFVERVIFLENFVDIVFCLNMTIFSTVFFWTNNYWGLFFHFMEGDNFFF